MKLEGSLFFIEEMPDQVRHDEGVYRIRLNPEHAIYKAHFPELPITPGVILVRIGVELLGRMLGRKVRLVGAPNIKFTAPVYPEGGKQLEYVIDVKMPDQVRHDEGVVSGPSSGISGPSPVIAGDRLSVIAGCDRQSQATIIVRDAETIYSKQTLRYE